MRKLIYSMTASLDGYVAGPDGEFDFSAPDPELHRFHNARVEGVDLHLLGRRLYEVMTYWETVDEDDPSTPDYALEFARIWKRLPKIVYSTTLDAVEGNTRLSKEDPVDEVRRLKSEPGKDIEVGGAGLAGTLMRAGLIDEYHLFVCPVILGGGTPFFASLGDPIGLELLETGTFSSRVVYLHYRQA